MYTNDIIILTGSYARGLQTEYSDIDFLVLTENTSRFHTDTIYEDGKEIQIIMVPLYKVQSMVQENTSPLYSVIVSMLNSETN
ncbi:MAG: nucleotidyltransferase domain-containing protein [Bacteroidales bacterium]|nr:nucleotidyltransferase domain-containing protein [Candidatus Egerieousia equi]